MKLERDLHLDVSRKLQNSVNVKVFAFRAGHATDISQRVCLGTLHMPEDYFRALRKVFEYGLKVVGARVTVSGSYFGGDSPAALGSDSPAARA
ncbi:MAG: hypothetical protein ACREON_06345 [Gemmatimonadaceae bacterium]